MLTVKYFCSWWGMENFNTEQLLQKIKHAEYNGVEMGIPADKSQQRRLKELLQQYDLDIIVQQYQAEGVDFEAYCNSFEKWIETAVAFHPVLVNSYTGKDYWSKEQNIRLIEVGENISKQYGVKVVHETHRGRFLYSAPVAQEYFNCVPEVKVTADFSHWVCVAESLLADQQSALNDAIRRTEHIHARVGFAEGPQVPDPFAPEWAQELEIFTSWWLRIAQIFQQSGREVLTITPEYGPVPYTWTLPFTGQPIHDFWKVNLQMRHYLKDCLSKVPS
jgi:sugar phosphate isomerase/epimerase